MKKAMMLSLKIFTYLLAAIGFALLCFFVFILFSTLNDLPKDYEIEKIIKDNDISKIEKLIDKRNLENYDTLLIAILDSANKNEKYEIIDYVLKSEIKLPNSFIVSLPKYSNEIISYYLNNGIDINTIYKTKEIETMYIYAAKYGSIGKIEFLVEHGADKTIGFPLHSAAQYGNKEIVEYMLNNGFNIDDIDDIGRTPLFCSLITRKHDYFYNNQMHVFLYLMDNGATKNIETKDGDTLFHYSRNTNVFILKELVESGLDINKQNNQGQTCLHYFVDPHEFSEYDFEFLINNGADPTIKDNNGKTAIDYYIEYFYEDDFIREYE